MMKNEKPCTKCGQSVCDYRRCEVYHRWLNEAWKQFQRFLPHRYWEAAGKNRFAYIHPNLIRRYLDRGPCAICPCAHDCDVPCVDYWCWWDARMAWLRWKLGREGSTV